MSYDVLVVGAGISGATIAQQLASKYNKKVLVIDKRNHIGGNCYDFIDTKTGVLASKYGAHLFHTNYEDVWQYINQFSNWFTYEHKVKSFVDEKLIPVPVNISTINLLFNTHITNEEEMRAWLKSEISFYNQPKNSEESALNRVGVRLYEKMFKNYTKKQWDLWPEQLEASVMDRIPVRYSYDERYFSDKYQALPENGYTQLFEKMLNHPNIRVDLNVSYKNFNKSSFDMIFFTGKIDAFFEEKYGSLQYRSLDINFEHHDQPFYQINSVINYPQTEHFTRIVEYKHFGNQDSKKTIISKEFPKWDGEPYYPVPNLENRIKYDKYKQEANLLSKNGYFFVGRLANYKYFNMDEAFKNALDILSTISSST